jgi:hypothetical protein
MSSTERTQPSVPSIDQLESGGSVETDVPADPARGFASDPAE